MSLYLIAFLSAMKSTVVYSRTPTRTTVRFTEDAICSDFYPNLVFGKGSYFQRRFQKTNRFNSEGFRFRWSQNSLIKIKKS